MVNDPNQHQDSGSTIHRLRIVHKGEVVPIRLENTVEGDGFTWSADHGGITVGNESQKGVLCCSREVDYHAPFDSTDDMISVVVASSGKEHKFPISIMGINQLPAPSSQEGKKSQETPAARTSGLGDIAIKILNAVLGSSVIAAIVTGLFAILKSQQPPTKNPEPSPSSVASTTIKPIEPQPRSITQQEAEDAVNRWLQAKPEILGKDSDPQSPEIQNRVRSLTTGFLKDDILKDGGSISDLRRDGQYWDYSKGRIDSTLAFKPDGNDRATITVMVFEERYLKIRRTGELYGDPSKRGRFTEKNNYIVHKIDGAIKICWYYDPTNQTTDDPVAIQECENKSP